MKVTSLAGSVTATALVVIGAAGACSDTAPPCRVDNDCPATLVCRDDGCVSLGADAVAPDVATGPACAIDGTSCTLPDECCSRTCTGARCAAPGTAQPAPLPCRGSFELCQNDCCAPFTCRGGVCR